jgi:thiol-disulfide isomerase/thioredoxin
MLRRAAVVAILAALVVQARAEDQSIISGKLLGSDGKPMMKAEVQVLDRQYNSQILATTVAGSDGSFSIKFAQRGLLYLSFTGVNHMQHVFPVLAEKPIQEKIEMRLKAYEYNDDLSQVKIIGDFNGFSFQSAQPMTPQADGTYVFETEVTADSFAYQILGAEKNGRSINGTQSDGFVYDGGGDYQSVMKVSGGKARIVFDPKKIVSAKSEDEVEAKFLDGKSLRARFYELHRAQEKRRNGYIGAFQAFRKTEKDMSKFSYDWTADLNTLSEKIADEKNAVLRQFLYLNYLQVGTMKAEDKLDRKTVDQAFAEIPAASSLWEMDPFLLSMTTALADENGKYDGYVQQALDKHPSRHVCAAILSVKLSGAAINGDENQAQSLYDRLKNEFGDLPEVQPYLINFNPYRAINKGMNLPSFSVASMDQPDVTYTNESMKGKIYLVDFWAVWCGPCVSEMPKLHAAYEKFKDKNFEILSLSFDPRPEDVKKFRDEKWKMPWLHAFVEKGFESELAKAFEVAGIPKPILVDGDTNTIIAVEGELRGSRLEETLSAAFASKNVAKQ